MIIKQICIWLFSLCFTWNSFGQSVELLECFFDLDPGFGNGTRISPANPMDTLDVTTTINTTGLAPGFHTFNLRARYTDGSWGLFQKRTFYIIESSQVQAEVPLAEQEFFFDLEPGPGNAASSTLAAPLDSFSSHSSLSTASLAPGFHTLNVRTKNTNGSWGLYQKRSFYILDSTLVGEADKVVEGQWFFDNDPGAGNPITFPVIADDTIDIIPTAFTPGLSPGFHTLNLRFKDQTGLWGLYQKRAFQILDTTELREPPLNQITYYYFKKDSNHVEQFTELNYSPRDTLDSLFTTSTIGMPDGRYYLKVWVRDTDLNWSHVATDSFTIGICSPLNPVVLVDGHTSFCFGDSVELTTDSNYDSYEWSTGEITSSIYVDESATIAVRVEQDGCSGNSMDVILTELPELLTPSVIAIGNDSLMSSEEAPSYQWYLDASIIGNNARTIRATSSGEYQVQLLNEQECPSDKSDFFTFWLTDLQQTFEPLGIQVYPNPGAGLFNVRLSAQPKTPLSYQLYNDGGQLIETEKAQIVNNTFTLAFESYPAGSYRLILYNDSQWGSFTLLIR